jgi:hypothetical protein
MIPLKNIDPRSKSIGAGPQAKAGIRYKKYLLSVRHRVVSVGKLAWIIPCHHLVKIGVAEIRPFDFFAREIAGAISDVEPAF